VNIHTVAREKYCKEHGLKDSRWSGPSQECKDSWESYKAQNEQAEQASPEKAAAKPISANAPTTDPAPAPVPATPVAQRNETGVQASTQTPSETGQGESLADAARKAKQYKACLDLAKDNPSIVRK